MTSCKYRIPTLTCTHRVFFRLLTDRNFSPSKFNLPRVNWADTVRVCAFAKTVWSTDTREYQERKRAPRVLDIGWCEAEAGTLTTKTGTHLSHLSNRGLAQKGLFKEVGLQK